VVEKFREIVIGVICLLVITGFLLVGTYAVAMAIIYAIESIDVH
jgi:hypothetical protein